MRRIVVALVGTVSGLIMLFSYHTSTGGSGTVAVAPIGAGTSTTTGSSGATRDGGSSTTSSDPSAGSSPGTTGSAGSSGTVTGDVVQTQWGPVQVRITVASGRITAAEAVRYPNGNGRDQEINAYALPVLGRAAVAAQGSDIDLVSGATVTSDGYVRSLQSAIDKANL